MLTKSHNIKKSNMMGSKIPPANRLTSGKQISSLHSNEWSSLDLPLAPAGVKYLKTSDSLCKTPFKSQPSLLTFKWIRWTLWGDMQQHESTVFFFQQYFIHSWFSNANSVNSSRPAASQHGSKTSVWSSLHLVMPCKCMPVRPVRGITIGSRQMPTWCGNGSVRLCGAAACSWGMSYL